MNKRLHIVIIVVIAIALICMAFAIKGTGAGMAAVSGCSGVVYNPAQQAGQDISHTFCFPNRTPPPFTPNVGWNS